MDYGRLDEETDPGLVLSQPKGVSAVEMSATAADVHVPPPQPSGPPPQYVDSEPPPPMAPYPGPPPVTVAPTMVQPTVVVNQVVGYGQHYPQNIRDWSTGLCNCCDNIGVCIFGMCCPCCQAMSVANRMHESGCCVVCCVVGGTIAMRTKLRTMYGIRGDITNDGCVMCWCHQCGVCQMAREQNMAPY